MTREEAGERIKQLGGKVSTSISKNTTYLIAVQRRALNSLKRKN